MKFDNSLHAGQFQNNMKSNFEMARAETKLDNSLHAG